MASQPIAQLHAHALGGLLAEPGMGEPRQVVADDGAGEVRGSMPDNTASASFGPIRSPQSGARTSPARAAWRTRTTPVDPRARACECAARSPRPGHRTCRTWTAAPARRSRPRHVNNQAFGCFSNTRPRRWHHFRAAGAAACSCAALRGVARTKPGLFFPPAGPESLPFPLCKCRSRWPAHPRRREGRHLVEASSSFTICPTCAFSARP